MKRPKIIFWLIIAFAGSAFNMFGNGPKSANQFINHHDWNFVENLGQLRSSEIKYYGHQGGVNLYCEPGKISFVFTKVGKEPDQISEETGKAKEIAMTHLRQHRSSLSALRSSISTSRTDLILLNSNPSAQIISSDQQEYYENFYLAHTPEEGITHVHTCKTITYKSIYPNIDLVLHAKPQGLKYEFVVYPGGSVSDIQIQWNGLENIEKLKDSLSAQARKIEYDLAFGNMTESEPYTYQCASPVRADPRVRPLSASPSAIYSEEGRTHGSAPYEEIESHFILKNNVIEFDVASYDKAKPLIIDPFLSWGTYFGGIDFESGNAVATDNSGNGYITGYAESQTGIATSGAFQTSFGGGNEDAFLAKFNGSGALIWATYYGGSGNDYGNGVVTDGLGNVYLVGNTSSSSGIATSGSYQASATGGAQNGFLAKFNGAGIRQWATYIGSSQGYGVASDVSGNAYIVGSTNNGSGLATSGAYQTSFAGGQDAFLAKFNGSGTIQWATYYGGVGGTSAIGVSSDVSGNVLITGYTDSPNGIATTGACQTSLAGVEDAFVAKFNKNGERIWATYYGGTPGSALGYGIVTDKYDDVYISGNTIDTLGIATIGAYQTSLSGIGKVHYSDAFIAKFNNTGAIQWATYYGGPLGDNNSLGIASDEIGNVYITGTTESSSGIATNGAYQTSFGNGNEHAYLAQFSNSGARLWATYYGGPDDDVGNGVATDGSGNVYITGYTHSTSGIATSGAYQTSLAGGQNAFLAQFNFKANYDAGVAAIFNGDTNICAGKQAVNVQLHNYGNLELDSLNIFWLVNGKSQTLYHWTGKLEQDSTITVNVGSYLFSVGKNDTITSWTSRPNGQQDSVSWNDTSSIILNINPLPVPDVGLSRTICQYDKITVGTTTYTKGESYSWTSKPVGVVNFNSPAIFVQPFLNTTYYLTVTNTVTGCSKTDSALITVNPAPSAKTGPSQTICFGDSINIGETASNGFTYSWISSPLGFSSTLSNPKISPASTTSYTLTETNTLTGCKNSNSVQISVNQLPVANVGLPGYSICNGTHVKIGANAQPGITYFWSSIPPGYSSTISNPVVDPAAYTNYYLTVTDTATGCVNKNFAKVAVSILKAPLINVGKSQAVCVGVSAQIGSIPVVGYTYAWTSNPVGFTSTSAEPTVKPLVTSSYSLIVTDSHSCTNFDSVTITVNPRPQPKTGAPQNTCSGTVIKLGAVQDSGHAYLWTSNPKGFSSKISDPVDSPDVSTEYYLKETISATGCADSDSVRITVIQRPNAQFDVKNINGFGWEFIIQKPNYPGGQYRWTFGDTLGSITDTASGYKVSHTYPQNGAYMVYLTISLPGYCTVIDSYRVVVNVTPSFDIFPNPFGLQTDIKYVLENPGHVKITMTDDIGKFIGTLVDNQLPRGEYITIFDAGAWKTRPAVYFIIFQLDDKITVRKIVQIDSIYH